MVSPHLQMSNPCICLISARFNLQVFCCSGVRMVSPSRSDAVFDLVVGERGKGWVSCRTETFEDLAGAFFIGLEALTFTTWWRYCDLCLTMTIRYVWIWMTKSYQKWGLFPSTISASRKKKGFRKLRWHNLDGYGMSHEKILSKKVPSTLFFRYVKERP